VYELHEIYNKIFLPNKHGFEWLREIQVHTFFFCRCILIMLRKIFGSVWDSGEWRVGYNVEIHELIEGHDIVRSVKA
jgi:uncharacterized Fe-S radical SAM superfamily protein PflX